MYKRQTTHCLAWGTVCQISCQLHQRRCLEGVRGNESFQGALTLIPDGSSQSDHKRRCYAALPLRSSRKYPSAYRLLASNAKNNSTITYVVYSTTVHSTLYDILFVGCVAHFYFISVYSGHDDSTILSRILFLQKRQKQNLNVAAFREYWSL